MLTITDVRCSGLRFAVKQNRVRVDAISIKNGDCPVIVRFELNPRGLVVHGPVKHIDGLEGGFFALRVEDAITWDTGEVHLIVPIVLDR